MENYKQELDKLLRDTDIFSSSKENKDEGYIAGSTYSQLIEELKNYSNIVGSFRRKSWLGKETLQLKAG